MGEWHHRDKKNAFRSSKKKKKQKILRGRIVQNYSTIDVSRMPKRVTVQITNDNAFDKRILTSHTAAVI